MDVLVVGHKTHKLFQEITFFIFPMSGRHSESRQECNRMNFVPPIF